MVDHIFSWRGSPHTVRLDMVCLRSFCDHHDVQDVNWKKIMRMLPPVRRVARDRSPTKEEIRAALEGADQRGRALLLVLASSGIREGAVPGLRLHDYERTTGTLVVYRGEPEEYTAFVSPEAMDALEKYLNRRCRNGETLGQEVPLFCRKDGGPLGTSAIRAIVQKMWVDAGIRKREKTWSLKEFKAVHGLRKFFKTYAPRGMAPETADRDVETMLGHATPYYRPSMDHLLAQYARAVPSLSVTGRVVEKDKEIEELRREIRSIGEQLKRLASMAGYTIREVTK